MNELLTTVQPTSQEEEEPNHLVSATYYENNTDSRGSLSPTVIPTEPWDLYVQFRAFQERQRNRVQKNDLDMDTCFNEKSYSFARSLAVILSPGWRRGRLLISY